MVQSRCSFNKVRSLADSVGEAKNVEALFSRNACLEQSERETATGKDSWCIYLSFVSATEFKNHLAHIM